MASKPNFKRLLENLEGELKTDHLHQVIYATDASVYRELPLGVVWPKHRKDIQNIVKWAKQEGVSLIPRAAGTSLAGQCVGSGLVLDTSRYMTRILAISKEEQWVRVQPGVIRDELNAYLKPYGLYFGPNTSTANRCMIGGMVGNNSCGTTSITYGSTREHLLEAEVVLSDGSLAKFGPTSSEERHKKQQQSNLEGQIFQAMDTMLQSGEVRKKIVEAWPRPEIHRRNTGYALDMLIRQQPYQPEGPPTNFCALLAGSEGTLAITTELKLNLVPLPPAEVAVVAVHFSDLSSCLEATQLAMEHEPTACELMDHHILELTKDNIQQRQNRFFVQGEPAALLLVEFRASTPSLLQKQTDGFMQHWKQGKMGYYASLVTGEATKKVWALRAAGLGVLSNMPGDAKPVACIEDTAVALQDLPTYISEFESLMKDFGQEAVYYAHAGAGELHLRPILNLKKEKDRKLFFEISAATAQLVRRYRGALSGEHGDGRIRAPFLRDVLGEENYQLLRQVKSIWDPQGIFNPGKIVDALPLDQNLRYEAGQITPEWDTLFDFSRDGGLLRAAERCNGSGDCRKLPFSGGTMCPSYQATRNEQDSTRARANMLRELLTHKTREAFLQPELKAVMDLCLSCKGCTAECPSNVDMATLKAEYLYQLQKEKGIPFRSRVFGNIARLNALAAASPLISNLFLRGKATAPFLKKILGVHPKRSLPKIYPSLRSWWKKNKNILQPTGDIQGEVFFFCDEFTNFNDVQAGKAAIQLLLNLGYKVQLEQHPESGRAAISKGLLQKVAQLAEIQVRKFEPLVSGNKPLVGLEPSAILSFRDEYPRLVPAELRQQANSLSENVLVFEEFMWREIAAGRIRRDQFTQQQRTIYLHAHCHQKALADIQVTAGLLEFPDNYSVEYIPSGCCGMAGSFGYEKEHYSLSMQIAEMVLFPRLRELKKKALVAAPGTSCRHQIWDGCGIKAQHPAEIMWAAFHA